MGSFCCFRDSTCVEDDLNVEQKDVCIILSIETRPAVGRGEMCGS